MGQESGAVFLRRQLAASPRRWRNALAIAALSLAGGAATVAVPIPYPVIVFAGILLSFPAAAVPPLRQALLTTGAAAIGAAIAVLVAIAGFSSPWLYLPLQIAALAGLIVASRLTPARVGFVLAALVVAFAEPPYLASADAAIDAALVNALAAVATAWAAALARLATGAPPMPSSSVVTARRGDMAALAMLVVVSVGAQMLVYRAIDVPDIRTGVIAALLTADPDLRRVWARMPLRQLGAFACGQPSLLAVAALTPLLQGAGVVAAIATPMYFAAGWVAQGGPRLAFAALPGAVAVTLVFFADPGEALAVRPSLLGLAGAHWGLLVTAVAARALMAVRRAS